MNDSFTDFENRKKDHIKLALDERTQSLASSDFSQIRLQHQALPEINFSDVQLTTQLLSVEFSSPHFISSMTAGHEKSRQINLNLAAAANRKNWLMAVGSQRRELTDTAAASEWKAIKAQFPTLQCVSNIGILEVLSFSTEEILRLAENLEAIGLFVHLNPLQEVFQGQQDVRLSGALKAIEALAKKSTVPILVKEVGFGINKNLTRQLFDIGVRVVDVSGRGGTHWAHLEALRQHPQSQLSRASAAFHDWGQSAVQCLLDLQGANLFSQIWASGGVRSGVDSAKCLALGARAVGVAQPLMAAAVQGEESVLQVMEQFDYELKVAMFCCGISRCEDFLNRKVWYGAKY